MPKISDESRRLFLRNINASMNEREVARLLEISYLAVSYIWNKYISTGPVDDRK